MKAAVSSLFAITFSALVGSQAHAALCASYTFTGASGSGPYSSAAAAPNSTISGLSVNGYTPTIDTGQGNPSPSLRIGAPTSQTAGDYLSFTLAASGGYEIDLTGATLSFDFSSNHNTKQAMLYWAILESVNGGGV